MCVCVCITVKQCVTETITPDIAALSGSGTSVLVKKKHIKMNKHQKEVCMFVCFTVCPSVCLQVRACL